MVTDLNVEKTQAYIKKLNEQQKEVKITMTHIITLATAIGLHKIRRNIGKIVWGYFKHQKKIGVTILCDVEGGRDLVPVTLWDAHEMTLLELAKKINEKIDRAKKNKDTAHN